MNRLTNLLGVLGGALGVAGLIAYSVAPGQLWLVTLCEGIALICLVAFFVAHVESLKAFSARRFTRLGVHSLLMVLLFAAILVIVNFLAARHSLRWDFSETQHFTLAPQTHRVLRGLHREVKITVFTQDRGQAFNRYHDLLDSYRQASDKLKVDFVDPERRPGVARHVADGGRLLILLDPDSKAELDDLLRQWGIEAGKGVLVDLQDRLAQGDLTALMVRTFTEHVITQDFTFAVLFPVSRHLVFHDAAGKDWDFVPLARTSARSWAETNLQGRVVSFSPKEDVQGPLPLAAALTPKKAPEEGKRHAAIVVVGNSAFASNEYINFPGNTDFLLHALGWLAEERELISITPKDPAFRPFIPNPTQERSLLYVQVFFFPVLTFLWGMTVWSRRRRL